MHARNLDRLRAPRILPELIAVSNFDIHFRAPRGIVPETPRRNYDHGAPVCPVCRPPGLLNIVSVKDALSKLPRFESRNGALPLRRKFPRREVAKLGDTRRGLTGVVGTDTHFNASALKRTFEVEKSRGKATVRPAAWR